LKRCHEKKKTGKTINRSQWKVLKEISFTAKLLRSPSDGDAMRVACLSVLGERRAQTLAVTAHIASARIQHAPIIQEKKHAQISRFPFSP
jgi:hypothetical protein